MTDNRKSPPGTTDDRQPMKHLRHSHADHDTRDWHWWHRGPAVAADGGRREDEEERDEMRDVSHTQDEEGHHANRVWDGTRVRESDDE